MELDPNNLSDWKECEFWIAQKLNNEQKRIVSAKNPYWESNPPQRESHLTPLDYALATQNYVNRVLEHEWIKNL